ncbi:MAG TPA: hypothetical protein VFV38_24600 [Ktedonobacteraceae bacterium]|nr:hypothetical protein [Ktedonobacteraceae bacterium]
MLLTTFQRKELTLRRQSTRVRDLNRWNPTERLPSLSCRRRENPTQGFQHYVLYLGRRALREGDMALVSGAARVPLGVAGEVLCFERIVEPLICLGSCSHQRDWMSTRSGAHTRSVQQAVSRQRDFNNYQL